MAQVSDEDKDGFINLNVRVHRSDLIDAAIGQDESEESDTKLKKRISVKKFKEIAQVMANNEPFSGGDVWSDACRDAYSAVMD